MLVIVKSRAVFGVALVAADMCGFEVVQDPRLLAVYRHWGIPETAKDGLGGVAWWAGVVAEVAAVIRANNVSAAVQAVLLWHADQRLARQRGQRPRAFDVPPETLKVRGVFWRNLLNGSFLMFIVGSIPCCIGLFFIKFENSPKR